MPQTTVNKRAPESKKKKGRPPAHQNQFAFRHNPNSKKTAKILDLPNVHVCRRCHDKIEWRKKYRKYKPRTQPGRCNICQQRRVMAAYHTICEPCSRTETAQKIVRDHLDAMPTTTTATDPDPQAMDGVEGPESMPQQGQVEPPPSDDNPSDVRVPNKNRACAMCVKDFSLFESEGDEEDDALNSGKKLTLRQRKTLERQRERERQKNSKKKRKDGEAAAGENGDEQSSSSSQESKMEDMDASDDDDDENDPFLKAVGGADKLLTGEAYQQALLQKERAKEHSS